MIRSEVFDDIYFSPDDGLAETRHVFLKGNNLPDEWAGKRRFTIAETGFGTGLNFLAAWSLFESTANSGAVLDYVSFEKFPLSAREIERALANWSGEFGGNLEKLVHQYPLRIPGWHRLDFGCIRLTLIFDDVNDALPRLACPQGIDGWFLDGFAPAKNPQMWTDHVFDQMARLSNEGASVATFSAAGIVRRGLAQAGFSVEKKPGYGRKREMVVARYAGPPKHKTRPHPSKKVAILGAGLAGTACAHVLKERGYAPVLFEASAKIASGASGNPLGIFNPRLSARRGAEADFYMSAFALGSRTFPSNRCGSLHLLTDDEKSRRLHACHENWNWHADHMQIFDSRQASAVAGVDIPFDALYLPDSGLVSPRRLCASWSAGIETQFLKTPAEKDLAHFDAVIFANAIGARDYISWLPIHTVRGQVIIARATSDSAPLKTNLCYGGYIGPESDGSHVVGSTFQKWLDDCNPSDEDSRAILSQLEDSVSGLGLQEVTGARASLRCSAQDRFPVIGAVPDKPGWYVSTGLGSHGMVSSLAGAHLLADLIDQCPFSLPLDTVNLLSPQRFLDRAARRGKNMV